MRFTGAASASGDATGKARHTLLEVDFPDALPIEIVEGLIFAGIADALF
jgi:hypothetical protein